MLVIPCLVCLVGFVAIGILCQEGSFLCWKSQDKMLFRRRPVENLVMVLLSLMIITGVITFCLKEFSPVHLAKLAAEGNVLAFVFMAVIYSIPAALLLWLAGPEELSLDLNRCTYRLVTGRLLVLRRTRSGTWAAIGGVYVKYTKAGYLVGVTVENGQRRVNLGRFGDDGEAHAEADRIGALLGLGKVKAPPASFGL